MPLTFPTSPTNGQTTTLSGTTYTYNATKGVWEATASGGGFVAGSFSEHILPSANETYDIGSAEKKIRHLFLSDNTLNIGSQSISADSEGIVMPAVTIGTGTNKVVLSATAEGGLKQAGINSSGVAAPITTGGGVGGTVAGDATTVVDMDGLIALTGMTTGQTALVTSLNRIFMYTGSGWFKIADMTNASPTAITGVAGTYALATDGTATVVTAISTDPEGFPLTWSYAVTTGSLGSTATVTQADNVFTITPSTTEAHAGTFSLTFSVTDGATGAVSAVSAFSLAFNIANHDFIMAGSKATRANHGDGANITYDFSSASTTRVQIDGSWAEYAATNTGIPFGNIILGTQHGQAKTGDGLTVSWYYKTPGQFSEPASFGEPKRLWLEVSSGITLDMTNRQLVESGIACSNGEASATQYCYQDFNWGNMVGSGSHAWNANYGTPYGWLDTVGTNSWCHMCWIMYHDKLSFYVDGTRINNWSGYDFYKTDLGYYLNFSELPIGHYTDFHFQSADVYGVTNATFTPPARRTY